MPFGLKSASPDSTRPDRQLYLTPTITLFDMTRSRKDSCPIQYDPIHLSKPFSVAYFEPETRFNRIRYHAQLESETLIGHRTRYKIYHSMRKWCQTKAVTTTYVCHNLINPVEPSRQHPETENNPILYGLTLKCFAYGVHM